MVSEMDFHLNWCSGWIRVSILDAQRLHLTRTCPVAIPRVSTNSQAATSKNKYFLCFRDHLLIRSFSKWISIGGYISWSSLDIDLKLHKKIKKTILDCKWLICACILTTNTISLETPYFSSPAFNYRSHMEL